MFFSFILTLTFSNTETPQFETQFETKLVRAGDAVSLLCNSSSGDLPIHHTWLKDQRPLQLDRVFVPDRLSSETSMSARSMHHQHPSLESELQSLSDLMPSNLDVDKSFDLLQTSHYRLQCQHSNCSAGSVTLLLSAVSQSDSGVFTCSAQNRHGNAQRQTRLLVQQAPETPSAITAHALSPNSVQITWTRPFDGNAPLLHYRIEHQPLTPDHLTGAWATSPDVKNVLQLLAPDSESSTLTSLNASCTYKIRLTAVNSIGASSPTTAVLITTFDERK
jgi:hypothetical protein